VTAADPGTVPKPGTYPCKSNKVQYATKGEAQPSRKHLAAKGDRNKVYKCDFCGWYHLGRRR
jgi:hypothetical protein